MRERMCKVWFLVVLLLLSTVLGSKTKQTNADPYDCKGNTPFFLQDPADNMCLGPYGFSVCDERALWVLNRRVGKETFSLASFLSPSTAGPCLERGTSLFGLIGQDTMTLGKCSKRPSQNWEFTFVDKTLVRLATKGMCVVRGAKGLRNSASLKPCTPGNANAIKLQYSPTAVHENGFYFKTADGLCFNGSSFRSCFGSESQKLLWGVGMKYIGGEGHRYFFGFNTKDRGNCLVEKGWSVDKGLCSTSAAMGKWGLSNGQLSTGNGKKCVSRRLDNSAVLTNCAEMKHEYLVMDIPVTYSSDDLADMVRNKDQLTAEEQATLSSLLQYHAEYDV